MCVFGLSSGRSALGGGCGAGVVDFDLFLADLAGHGFLLGDGFGAEPDPFDGDRFGGDDGPFCVQDHFVFFFGDRRPGQGVPTGRVGDRFPFDPDFFAGDWDLHRLLFGDNVFAEPGAAGFDLLGADPELLLGSGHRLVGVRAGRVITLAAAAVAPSCVTAVGDLPVPGHALTAGVAEVLLVVGVQRLLLVGVEVAGVGDAGGVLHDGLVVGQDQVVAGEAGPGEWGEVFLHTEQSGVHGDPVRLPGLVVEVDLAD